MVMVTKTSVSSVTVLSLLAQNLHVCIYPVSERMGKQRILEAVFQVSEVHQTVTFLITKSRIQNIRIQDALPAFLWKNICDFQQKGWGQTKPEHHAGCAAKSDQAEHQIQSQNLFPSVSPSFSSWDRRQWVWKML